MGEYQKGFNVDLAAGLAAGNTAPKDGTPKESPMFHRDFPDDVQEMWELIAKALMLREDCAIEISADELKAAAGIQAELRLEAGSITLRRETN